MKSGKSVHFAKFVYDDLGFFLLRLVFKTRSGRNLTWPCLLPCSLQFCVFQCV